MRSIISLVLVVFFVGCITIPRYKTVPYSFDPNPSMSYQQALSICEPIAELEARKASQQVEQQQLATSQSDSYECDTTYSSYTYSSKTQCKPKSKAKSAFEAFNSVQVKSSSYNETMDLVLKSCLAEKGWSYKRVCVENCGTKKR